ncbi:hypothetical protein CDL12_24058 [Handroanthus impetiginosus]|uniref:G protein gamma domain-containing protein n=1 Tax=Handroanthus impetiginosus TaxID=429701 RepID=A0A2G9GDR2_9LAMI|nr:hypothetical protein CDL12_24058 [Handroanthus impetiginosus]
MSGLKANDSAPLPPPALPKSLPEYPDLYGKRRELAKLQVLEREIGFLEEELKSVQGLQPASRPCKEVADFVTCSADPFIPLTKKVHRSCRFWKWLWICCCCSSATSCRECGNCSCRNGCGSCQNSRWKVRCVNMLRCRWSCFLPKCPSCLTCCSIRCRCYPNCPKVSMCSC